jgi:tripartite-type tricarboxylate transporter receptor subunit TctC
MEAKLDIVHIPYKGTGPMLTDLLGGRTEATFNGVPPIAGQIKSGKLRPLAVGSARRIATLPDVPTIAESGYPGFETSQWYGILVPAVLRQRSSRDCSVKSPRPLATLGHAARDRGWRRAHWQYTLRVRRAHSE